MGDRIDLQRQGGDSGTAGRTGRSPPTQPQPSPHPAIPSPAWPPAEMGLTSYFCCFIFSIRSNFSDSNWWIQSDSSWAFSLAGQKGCHGREPGQAMSPKRLRELFKATQRVSEFDIIGAILLIFEATIFKVNCSKGVLKSLPTSPYPKQRAHVSLREDEHG